MRERERKLFLRKLDVEMRPFRLAGRTKNPTSGLLRAVRQGLGIPTAEVSQKMGARRNAAFDIEVSELRGTISLKSMSRMAEAMDCKVVYGVVPKGGKTMERLAEERLWAELLGVAPGAGAQGSGNKE
jgi:predicted DNA-binding mobile mystery protein A